MPVNIPLCKYIPPPTGLVLKPASVSAHSVCSLHFALRGNTGPVPKACTARLTHILGPLVCGGPLLPLLSLS